MGKNGADTCFSEPGKVKGAFKKNCTEQQKMNNTNSVQQWNKVYDEFKGNRLSVWREHATPFFADKIEHLKHLKFKHVLDAGCGDGRNLIEFAKAGFDVT